jgi:hypothetical protein
VSAQDLSHRSQRIGTLQGELICRRLPGERVHLPNHRRQVGRKVVKLVVQAGSQTSPAKKGMMSQTTNSTTVALQLTFPLAVDRLVGQGSGSWFAWYRWQLAHTRRLDPAIRLVEPRQHPG